MNRPILVSANQQPSRSGFATIGRWLGICALTVAGLAALIYVGDTALFYLRGKPQDQVAVTRYLATPLKDHKTEYLYEGEGNVSCSKTIFPQGGMDPCWYRKKHPLYSENL